MISNLTKSERLIAFFILAVLAFCGLIMAALGRHDPLAVHGWLTFFLAVGAIFYLIRSFEALEPPPERLSEYYDDPTKVGVFLTLAWGVFGMFFGVWVAALLAFPELTFDAAWSSFGRIRPVHTTGVIFGFAGNALIATSFHVMQRTTRARLPDQLSPWFGAVSAFLTICPSFMITSKLFVGSDSRAILAMAL